MVKKRLKVRTKSGPEYDEEWSNENGFGWIEPSFCYADDDGDSEDPFQDYDDPFKPQDDSFLDEMQEELDKLQEDNLDDIFDYLNEELASNEQRDETKSKKLEYNRKNVYVSYSSFNPTNCREAAYAIAKKLGTTISDYLHRTDIATRNSNGTGNINKEATRNALETMRNSINAGKPFIMGVSKSDLKFL